MDRQNLDAEMLNIYWFEENSFMAIAFLKGLF